MNIGEERHEVPSAQYGERMDLRRQPNQQLHLVAVPRYSLSPLRLIQASYFGKELFTWERSEEGQWIALQELNTTELGWSEDLRVGQGIDDQAT